MVAVKKSGGIFRDNSATAVPNITQRCKTSIEPCTAPATLTVVLANGRAFSVINSKLAGRQTICKSLQPAKSFDHGSSSGRRCDELIEAGRIEARRTLRELLIAEQLRDPDSASCQSDAGDSCHRLTLIPFLRHRVYGVVRFSETRSEGPARCLSCVFEIEYAEGE
jgi:hypothetical protein